MSEANDKQEGGSHYKQSVGVPEHWDLAVMYQWDPFQYQITKYLMRWKVKHGTPEKRLVDLKKAQHFLEKYIEVWECYDSGIDSRDTEDLTKELSQHLITPITSQSEGTSNDDWKAEGYFGDLTQLYKCKHCGYYQRARTLQDASQQHDCRNPGPGYVNQG